MVVHKSVGDVFEPIEAHFNRPRVITIATSMGFHSPFLCFLSLLYEWESSSDSECAWSGTVKGGGGCHLLAASERTFFTSLETIQIHKALPLTVSALQHYAWPCVCVCLSVCIHAFHQLTSHAWWVKMSHLLRFQCESVALHSWNQCWSFDMHTLFFIFFLL